MALFGSDFNPTIPRDTDPVENGASEIRDIKRRMKDFVSVLFDPETGTFKQVTSSITMASSDPTNPNLGNVYYNTTDQTAYIFTSTGWVPLLKPSLPVGALIYHTGTIASITSSFANLGGTWRFANGDAISRSTFADYFALVGVTYGVGDSSTTFNIPDLRDKFTVSASADDSGLAKSTISDGSTLLKSRGYTNHTHLDNNLGADASDGGGGIFHNYQITGGTTREETSRAIPPFIAQVPVIRIK